MWAYIIPVLIVTVFFIVYGLLNVDNDEGSGEAGPSGCEHCGSKDSCQSKGHDDFVHFEIHKPDMNPAEGLFGKKKPRERK